MIDFALVLLALTFLALTIWLRNVTKYKEGQIGIEVFLSPEPNVETAPIYQPSKLKLLYENVKEWLTVILPYAFLLGLILLIATLIYALIRNFSSGNLASIITVVVSLVIAFLYIWFFRRRYFLVKIGGILGALLPHYTGDVKFPRKVYEGDSKNITITLQPRFYSSNDDKESLIVHDTKQGKSITLHSRGTNAEECLEIEMQAAAFSVEGEKKQSQPLSSDSLQYQWNCYFPNSGNHTFGLKPRLISPSSKPRSFRLIELTVKVAKLDHLTKRQIWLLALFTGVITYGLALAETLHKLGLW